jgi:hypothetical protein
LDKKELIRQFNGNLSELRKIINSFGLIPNAPSDEFDNLNHKLLRQLDKEVDKEKISKILSSELIVAYGLYDNEFDNSDMTDRIIDWWNSKY